MAYTRLLGTNFGMGSIDLPGVTMTSTVIDTTHGEGPYCVALTYDGQGIMNYYRMTVPGSRTDVAFGLRLKPHVFFNTTALMIRITLTDGLAFYLRYNLNHWDLYNWQDVLLATGAVQTVDAFQQIELNASFANSGSFYTRIEGTDDISYTGDTMPGVSGEIAHIGVYVLGAVTGDRTCYFGNISLGYGGFPGDKRYDVKLVNADIQITNWTPSTGLTVFATVDEIPPSDADYSEVQTNAAELILDTADWDGTGKTPLAVWLWARVKKDEADAHLLALNSRDGVNLDTGSAQAILETLSYIKEPFLLAPDGGAWDETKVNTLQIGATPTIV